MAYSVILAILFCLVLLGSSPVFGHEDSSQSTNPPEELVEIEELSYMEESEGPGHPLKSFLGSLHPALVHFPIAWMALLGFVELVGMVAGRVAWHRAGAFLLLLAVASFIPAIITGLLQSDLTTFAGQYTEILDLHRNLNFLVAGLGVAALIVRWRCNTEDNRFHRIAYLAIILIATATALYSGHLGGQLVHG